MEFMKTEDGMVTALLVALAAAVAVVGLAFYNALQNITLTAGF
jgi:hypothetical protein